MMVDYKFRELEKIKEKEKGFRIDEGFTFQEFNTFENGYYLISREAPVPQTRGEEVNIPFIQGSIDFSFWRGIRFFDNRTLKFEIFKPDITLQDIKKEIIDIRELFFSQLTPRERIYDSYTPEGSYWLGKCVDVIPKEEHGGVTFSIEFSVYPFLFIRETANNDSWDEFNFFTGIAQSFIQGFIQKKNSGERDVIIINNGGYKTPLYAQIIHGMEYLDPNNIITIRSQKTQIKRTQNPQLLGDIEIGINTVSFEDMFTGDYKSFLQIKLFFMKEVLA